MIANVQTNDSGIYVVTVANEFGNVTSTPATLTVNTEGIAINLYAGVTIVGEVGKSYQIRYTTNLSQPTWVPLTNVTLTAPIQLWFDPDPAARERRFYSVSLVP